MTTLDLTPNAHAGHWTARYVGRLWAPVYTCWHLFGAVQREVFRREVPELDVLQPLDGADVRALIERSAWRRLDGGVAVDGDALVMRGPDGVHIGVVARHGVRPKLLHNMGGLVAGVAHGSVRLDAIADLGRLGYGRFELWGPPA
jgi:hypothetical protein